MCVCVLGKGELWSLQQTSALGRLLGVLLRVFGAEGEHRPSSHRTKCFAAPTTLLRQVCCAYVGSAAAVVYLLRNVLCAKLRL